MYLVKRLGVLGLVAVWAGAFAGAQDVGAMPKWFKGNLHAHSLWSDGDDFPEMVADRYREKGYHFLVLSEHNVLARGPRWKSVEDKAPGLLSQTL